MTLSATLRSCRTQLTRLLRTPTPCASSVKYVYPEREMHRQSIYQTEKAKKIRFYVIHKYIEYLKSYDKILEKKFPGTVQTYRVFMDGVNDFMADSKEYFKIVLLLHRTNHDFSKLLRREMELYIQMPKDMRKVAPILIMATLPLAFYFVFPLIYAFPKQLLCSHFWTLQQKSTYSMEYLRGRLLHNRPVFRHLQSQMNFLKKHPLCYPWSEILGILGSGQHPTPEQILKCKDLFKGEPYNLLYLSRNHVKHLAKMHDLHMGWLRRVRLSDHAAILIEMDKAIIREGGVHNLPFDALRKACYIRGLNPVNMKNEEMIKWLQDWTKISSQIDNETLSLLLHCPILLGYNEPSNWRIIYSDK